MKKLTIKKAKKLMITAQQKNGFSLYLREFKHKHYIENLLDFRTYYRFYCLEHNLQNDEMSHQDFEFELIEN